MKTETTTNPVQDYTATGLGFNFNLQNHAVDDAPPAGDETPPADNNAPNGDEVPPSGDNLPPADDAADKSTEPPLGAPEAYTDYTLPEGIEYNKEFAATFNEVAKELNLTQAQAQRLVDLQASNVKMSMDLQAKQNADWVKESEKTHGKEGIEQANRALARFSSPEYVQYLQDSGQGNNPAVIAQWRKVAEMISEDKHVGGDSNSTKSAAEILYPSMK